MKTRIHPNCNRHHRHLITAVLALTALMATAAHPWLTHVYEYCPAPGQFINMLPEYSAGEPIDSVLARCETAICGHIDTTTSTLPDGTVTQRIDTVWASEMVCLGGYGGYIIVGFDHPVVNMHTFDFNIYGNAFEGNSEPGIVVVGVDADGDGVPSAGDKWYELEGSSHHIEGVQPGYQITYYRPDESSASDDEYIRWTSNDVNSDSTTGYMARNAFHTQPYWPQWIDAETLSFTGTKLPCNAVTDASGNFVLPAFGIGYVDNLPNPKTHDPIGESEDGTYEYNPGFMIDWAVDEEGNSVELTHIDFIKIYCGINQVCGWIGETSTEVCEGVDYHPEATLPEPTVLVGDVNLDGNVDAGDIACVVNIVAGAEPAGTYGTRDDVNGDGKVDSGDVSTLATIIAGN